VERSWTEGGYGIIPTAEKGKSGKRRYGNMRSKGLKRTTGVQEDLEKPLKKKKEKSK